MAQKTYNNLITGITSTIKNNTNKSISGDTLQVVLVDIVDSLYGAFSGDTGTNESGGIASGFTVVYSASTGIVSNINMGVVVLEIGAWNMDSDANKSINTTMFGNVIYNIQVLIIDDLSADMYNLNTDGYFVKSYDSNAIVLNRTSAGIFDNTSFASILINRGWIYITYRL